MAVQAYLDRIHYSGSPEPSVETLRSLHVAHMRTVPFESLDILPLRRPIVLEETALFDKVVHRHRGGFCYELNGLFSWLLRQLGFQVTLWSAGVMKETGAFGPPYDHLVLSVKSPVDPIHNWLVDVGFGDSFQHPLRLEFGVEQTQPAGRYRLLAQGKPGDGASSFIMQAYGENQWQDKFLVTRSPCQLQDFAEMCHHQQTDSLFTRKRLCSRATPQGRITLSDMQLIVTENGVKQTKNLSDEAAYVAVLDQYFQIRL